MTTTKVQYLTIDSHNIDGDLGDFTIDLYQSLSGSSTSVNDIKNIIGFRVTDCYFANIGYSGTAGDSPKYIDIVCEDIPPPGQMIIANNTNSQPQVLARIPLERGFSGSNNLIVQDKQWAAPRREVQYFTPLNLQKLNFKIFERQNDGDYDIFTQNPSNNRAYYFTVELTSIVPRQY